MGMQLLQEDTEALVRWGLVQVEFTEALRRARSHSVRSKDRKPQVITARLLAEKKAAALNPVARWLVSDPDIQARFTRIQSESQGKPGGAFHDFISEIIVPRLTSAGYSDAVIQSVVRDVAESCVNAEALRTRPGFTRSQCDSAFAVNQSICYDIQADRQLSGLMCAASSVSAAVANYG